MCPAPGAAVDERRRTQRWVKRKRTTRRREQVCVLVDIVLCMFCVLCVVVFAEDILPLLSALSCVYVVCTCVCVCSNVCMCVTSCLDLTNASTHQTHTLPFSTITHHRYRARCCTFARVTTIRTHNNRTDTHPCAHTSHRHTGGG